MINREKKNETVEKEKYILHYKNYMPMHIFNTKENWIEGRGIIMEKSVVYFLGIPINKAALIKFGDDGANIIILFTQ